MNDLELLGIKAQWMDDLLGFLQDEQLNCTHLQGCVGETRRDVIGDLVVSMCEFAVGKQIKRSPTKKQILAAAKAIYNIDPKTHTYRIAAPENILGTAVCCGTIPWDNLCDLNTVCASFGRAYYIHLAKAALTAAILEEE